MNTLDLLRMSIKNVTVVMTESRKLRTLLGSNNKTVSLEDFEPMIIDAAAVAPEPSAREYDKVFIIVNYINGESKDHRMDLTTKNNDLLKDVGRWISNN